MKKKKMINAVMWTLITMIVVQGCTVSDRGRLRTQGQSLPPELVSVSQSDSLAAPPAPDTVHAAQLKDLSLPITSSLLDMVDDSKARALVNEAIQNNHDLQATALKLEAAGLLLSRTDAARKPRLDAGYTASRENEAEGFGATGQHKISLSLSWELDLWGKLSHRHDARISAFEADRLLFKQALDSLGARVMQGYFNVISAERQLDIQQQRVKIYEHIETTIQTQYRSGLVSLNDISAAKTKTETARADVVNARELQIDTARELELLMGRYPDGKTAMEINGQLPRVIPPAPLVPTEILANRPDIQAALKQVMSARSDADADQKKLFPDITLSADLFRAASHPGNPAAAGSSWGIVGNLIYPIFNAGQLKNEADASHLQADAAQMAFAQQVLQAMKEAESTFAKEKELKARLKHLESALTHAEKSSRYYESLYRKGLTGILELHHAKDQVLTIMSEILDLQTSRLTNRVEMALALGIGLSNQTDFRNGF